MLSFLVLCSLVGALTAGLILDDLPYRWATIPAVALLGFVGYRAMRVKVNREQFYLAMLLAMMVTAAMGKLWPIASCPRRAGVPRPSLGQTSASTEVNAVVERFLLAVGNKDLDALPAVTISEA